MRFEQQPGGVWVLIDEKAPPEANIIAAVKGPVEVLALKGLCEAVLTSPTELRPFDVSHDGRSYRVTMYPDRDGRLSLRIDGSDGSLSRVETEFRYPTEGGRN